MCDNFKSCIRIKTPTRFATHPQQVGVPRNFAHAEMWLKMKINVQSVRYIIWQIKRTKTTTDFAPRPSPLKFCICRNKQKRWLIISNVQIPNM